LAINVAYYYAHVTDTWYERSVTPTASHWLVFLMILNHQITAHLFAHHSIAPPTRHELLPYRAWVLTFRRIPSLKYNIIKVFKLETS